MVNTVSLSVCARSTCNSIPHDATSEFYDLTGNINYEHLRSVKTTEIAVDNDDESVDPGMTDLQPCQHEDTSSDDDSDDDKNSIKTSTTMKWKFPVDDSNGEKFICQRVREQRAKRSAKTCEQSTQKGCIKEGINQKYALC
jgi:hypothetical protein